MTETDIAQTDKPVQAAAEAKVVQLGADAPPERIAAGQARAAAAAARAVADLEKEIADHDTVIPRLERELEHRRAHRALLTVQAESLRRR